ncbi:hypothetical protein [Clostridium minihomine]|uniref:hypothetical protein n=1 Tax=Clostridium minihomine TaxID=2045012 RepID=UPI000C77819C|nr:hypothetical protein [Clostridium minihomine]
MKNSIRFHSFFIEIIFVLLFTAISSVAILQLFTAARTTALKSEETNYAMAVAQTAVETMHSLKTPSDFEKVFAPVPGNPAEDTVSLSGYDKNWNPTQENAVYFAEKKMQSIPTDAGVTLKLDVLVYSQKSGTKNELFSLSSQKYFPNADLPEKEGF